MPSLLSLAAFEGWLWPIAVVGVFVLMELFTNMVLETLLWGESAGVSPVALLIAVAFWTWLWGPIGLLMATPLTVCLVVLGKYVPQLEFITVLMSDEPVADKNMIYYQRLLAMDQDEAAHIVAEYLKTNPGEQIYDDVLLPALSFARADRERGSLTDRDEQFVYQATRAIVEAIDGGQGGAVGDPIIENLKPVLSGVEGSKIDNAEAARGREEKSRPQVRVLGCPARDEADEVALLMFRKLLDATRYQVDVIGEEKLASEVIAHADTKKFDLVCIAAVHPGGQAHSRYLCKRLRNEFPDLRIVVGLWGFTGELNGAGDSLLSAGADQIGTTLLQTRDQIGSLSQLISESTKDSSNSHRRSNSSKR